MEAVEAAHVGRVLRMTGGNVMKAARILNIDRVTLYNKIKKYNLPR
jgi:two-component system response regulator HydG